MPNLNILKNVRDIDSLTDLAMRSFPQGYLYESDELRNLLKGFLVTFLDVYLEIEKNFSDLFYLNTDNYYLEEFKRMYGLPNPIFPDSNTVEEDIFAITMMKLSQTLISVQDWENFMLLLGFNVKFYSLNNTLLESSTFQYTFPFTFSNSITTKDKLTYWIYVEEPEDTVDDFNNIGDAFDLDFVEVNTNLQKVQKILDFLKPDYLIFHYITLYTKNLYGL